MLHKIHAGMVGIHNGKQPKMCSPSLTNLPILDGKSHSHDFSLLY